MSLSQRTTRLSIATRGKGMYEFTHQVEAFVGGQGFAAGLLTVFVEHTSASLLIQENADPDVQTDLARYFERIAPEERGRYVHTVEGPDDMPAHIRAALTQTHLAIPLIGGQLSLGTWQGIYLFEHRSSPHTRRVALHLLGE
jgi:secondary thiamine-phosphate synthase enzyme